MSNHRTLSITLGIVVGLFALSAGAFPAVVSVQGKAWMTSTDGKRVVVKPKMLLRGKALLETSADSKIRINWDDTRELQILESSQVLIPTIGWDSGEATLILLKEGSFRWLAPEGKTYNVALSSDLFEFIAPPGDFILSYDPTKAFVSAKMLKGAMEFTYLNGEDVVKLKEGHEVGFQGVLEEGRVVYDVLLKGRKVPRGKLTVVNELSKDFLKANDASAEKKKRAVAEKARLTLIVKKTDGQICSGPAAAFNQCSWVCEGNPKKEKKICHLEDPQVKCIRQRCNANGQWAEKAVIEAEKAQSLCKVQPRIATCDY